MSPAEEARRCLDAGAVGIKLHPRAEQFTLHEPGVREIVAVAHEREVPMLIHAGRGIPAWAGHGRAGDGVPRRPPDPRPRGDLGSGLAVARPPDHPNVFIDTAWWNPADQIALFSLVDAVPHRLGLGLAVRATDRSRPGRTRALRSAGGCERRGPALVMGGQPERLVTGADPL